MTVVTDINEIKIGDIIKLDYTISKSYWYVVECFDETQTNTFLGPQRRCQLVHTNDPVTTHGEYFTIHQGWFNKHSSVFTVLNR